MTTGAVQWLSAIPGAQTETKPSTLGQIKSSLGVAISASEMSVNITRGATVERINGSGMADTAISTTSYADTSGTLVLTAGTWNVYLSITTELALSSLSGGTRLWHSVAITKADNTIIGEAQGACIETGQSPLRNMGTVTINRTVELSGSDTLKIRGKIALWAAETYATTTSRQYTGGGALVAFYAIRIA
jgi:hypothetical protein